MGRYPMMYWYYLFIFFEILELVRSTCYAAESSFSSESVNIQTVDKLIFQSFDTVLLIK